MNRNWRGKERMKQNKANKKKEMIKTCKDLLLCEN